MLLRPEEERKGGSRFGGWLGRAVELPNIFSLCLSLFTFSHDWKRRLCLTQLRVNCLLPAIAHGLVWVCHCTRAYQRRISWLALIHSDTSLLLEAQIEDYVCGAERDRIT